LRAFKFVILILSFLCFKVTLGQINISSFKIDDVPFSLSLSAKGFAEEKQGISFDPFYHGSALLQSNLNLKINNIAYINVRAANEIWSFSQEYSVMDYYYDHLWARPSIGVVVENPEKTLKIKLPLLKYIDTVQYVIGDLYRRGIGNGLLLEDFESQGSYLKLNFLKNFYFEGTSMGAGWTMMDDFRIASLGFSSYIKFSYVNHFYQDDYISNEPNRNRIFDLALNYSFSNFELKSELARNSRNKSYGFLGGVNYKLEAPSTLIKAEAQFRHYDKEFFYYTDSTFYPSYFLSMTAIDKPLNNYQLYQLTPENQNAFGISFYLRQNLIDKFFLNFQWEQVWGNHYLEEDAEQQKFAYDTSLEYFLNRFFLLKLGMHNKFMRNYFDIGPGGMFILSKIPSYYARFEVSL